MTETSGRERVLVLVKALPHAVECETVCCAGVTATGQWRRQFPIHFRTLEQKFRRWQWIDYEWRKPKEDQRPESRRVQEHTIVGRGEMPEWERSRFLGPLFVPSTEAATAKGQTLALIRPRNVVRFGYKKKKPREIEKEREAYASVARHGSFFR